VNFGIELRASCHFSRLSQTKFTSDFATANFPIKVSAKSATLSSNLISQTTVAGGGR
jgi:hypothetical protein